MTARLGHEAEHHAQPQAGALALLLGREKWFEDFGHHLRRHAGSGVGYRDHGVVPRRHRGVEFHVIVIQSLVARGDRQPAALRHGVARVGGEVQQARLDLGRIGDHRP